MLKATRFDSKYLLISFYVTERRNQNKVWEVYGWRGAGDCDDLGEFNYEMDAVYMAFTFGLPVIMGEGGVVDGLARRLEPWMENRP